MSIKIKKEWIGVVLRIAAYVVIMSVVENVCANQTSNLAIQVWRAISAALILAAIFFGMVQAKNFEQLGLVGKMPLLWKSTLFLVPMFVIATANLWHGIVIRYTLLETILNIVAMLCIGFTEEILFRGYLLRLLMKRSTRFAILISSLTFALGHIVNLANGAELVPTLLQLVYALAIGLMLSVFVVKTGHLLPCCLFHGVFNALAAFSNETGQTIGYQIAVCAIISLLSVGYAVYLWKQKLTKPITGITAKV